MRGRRDFVLYLAVFLAASLIAGVFYRVIVWGGTVMACRHLDSSGTFLAYCSSPEFAYYEHGAYFYDLEPAAVESLKKADVIFLGSSHEQIGFSTDEVEHYFEEKSLPYYLLGFSYGETHEFAEYLFKKYHLTPKVLVIVADPFFSPGATSPVSTDLLARDNPVWKTALLWRDYAMKKIFGEAQVAICRHVAWACADELASFYRRADTGAWVWRNLLYTPNQTMSFPDPSTLPALPADQAMAGKAAAIEFLKIAHVSPSCVVLTDVPNDLTNAQPFAKEMAELLGADAIFPHLNNLSGVDPGHLSWESAQLWSATFMHALTPVIERCIDNGPRAER